MFHFYVGRAGGSPVPHVSKPNFQEGKAKKSPLIVRVHQKLLHPTKHCADRRIRGQRQRSRNIATVPSTGCLMTCNNLQDTRYAPFWPGSGIFQIPDRHQKCAPEVWFQLKHSEWLWQPRVSAHHGCHHMCKAEKKLCVILIRTHFWHHLSFAFLTCDSNAVNSKLCCINTLLSTINIQYNVLGLRWLVRSCQRLTLMLRSSLGRRKEEKKTWRKPRVAASDRPRQSHVDARVTSRHTNAQTCWQQKQRGEANFFSLWEGEEIGGGKRGRKGDYNLIRGRKSCWNPAEGAEMPLCCCRRVQTDRLPSKGRARRQQQSRRRESRHSGRAGDSEQPKQHHGSNTSQ